MSSDNLREGGVRMFEHPRPGPAVVFAAFSATLALFVSNIANAIECTPPTGSDPGYFTSKIFCPSGNELWLAYFRCNVTETSAGWASGFESCMYVGDPEHFAVNECWQRDLWPPGAPCIGYSHKWGRIGCDGPPGLNQHEACDGIDNDGDFQTDEDDCDCCFGQTSGTVNGITLGTECGRAGDSVCPAGTWICDGFHGALCASSSGNPSAPGTEVCNGQDDDCDGVADEGLDCGCMTGRQLPCCGGGWRTCSDKGQWGACVGGSSSPEICDGIDNDCDGQRDEGLSCPDPAGSDNDVCGDDTWAPVNLAQGSMATNPFFDISIADANLSLSLSRRWTSARAYFDYDFDSDYTPLASGWTHNFDQYLVRAGEETWDGSLIWRNGDGQDVLFPHTTSGYGTPVSRHETLELISTSPRQYRLTRPDGSELIFQLTPGVPRAQLFRIKYGPVELEATYFTSGSGSDCAPNTTSHPANYLCKVTNIGRVLYFDYGKDSHDHWHLVHVRHGSPTTTPLVTYAYRAVDCDGAVNSQECPDGMLCCSMDASGSLTRAYKYADGIVHYLREVDDGAGDIMEWETWAGDAVEATGARDFSVNISRTDLDSEPTCDTVPDGALGDPVPVAVVTNSFMGSSAATRCIFQADGLTRGGRGGCGTGSCGTSPDSESVFEFDSNGTTDTTKRLRSQKTNEVMSVFTRDPLGRLTQVTRSGGTAPWTASETTHHEYVATTKELHLKTSTWRPSVTGGASDRAEETTSYNVVSSQLTSPLPTGRARSGQTVTDVSLSSGNLELTWGPSSTGTTYDYSSSGGALSVVTTTGPLSTVVQTFYDASSGNSAGRVHTSVRTVGTSPNQVSYTTTYGATVSGCAESGYDLWGHPLTVTGEDGRTWADPGFSDRLT